MKIILKVHDFVTNSIDKNIFLSMVYKKYLFAREYVVMPLRRLRYIIRGRKQNNLKQIPIIINNYNRLTYLELLIESLEKRGYNNIFIIDNNSSYPPLLDYYASCNYKVFFLKENMGYCALWKSGIFEDFKNAYYVYTDSDMQIDENCPEDFMKIFMDIMNSKFYAQKVGFGLRIDDLPNCFKNKTSVVEWEKQYWVPLEYTSTYFKASIDTTFALYRPYCFGPSVKYKDMYRTNFPYVIKHLPWYVDSDNMDQEEIFYINSITKSTHWSKQSL